MTSKYTAGELQAMLEKSREEARVAHEVSMKAIEFFCREGADTTRGEFWRDFGYAMVKAVDDERKKVDWEYTYIADATVTVTPTDKPKETSTELVYTEPGNALRTFTIDPTFVGKLTFTGTSDGERLVTLTNEQMGDGVKRVYCRGARAAIAAMREEG